MVFRDMLHLHLIYIKLQWWLKCTIITANLARAKTSFIFFIFFVQVFINKQSRKTGLVLRQQ